MIRAGLVVDELTGREAIVVKACDGTRDGLALLVFPHPTGYGIAGLMMGGQTVHGLGPIEESTVKEAGNIPRAAYMNAFAEFLHMRIRNSPLALAMDTLANDTAPLRGFFLLLPDPPSLRRMLTATRAA